MDASFRSPWVYTPSVAGWVRILFFGAIRLPWISLPGCSIFPCLLPVCSFPYSRSLASQPLLSLKTSGLGASLELSPYSSALPSLPLQYALAAALLFDVPLPTQCGASPFRSRGLHQSRMRSSFALLPLFRFYKLSCNPRPVGSLPSFEWDDVSTPIRTITARHSLPPTSYTRTPNSIPYGLPALAGGNTGLPRST